MSTIPKPTSALGWWRLRNGAYAKIIEETPVGLWKGRVYQENGSLFMVNQFWDRRLNNLITKDFDLMKRKGGTDNPGWPPFTN